MRNGGVALVAELLLMATCGCPFGEPAGGGQETSPAGLKPGTEEFGLTKQELVEKIEKVETLIAERMREQGFDYVAADYDTVRRGMLADKTLPGLSEREFHEQYGYGVATLYTGLPPQLNEGYSPGREGLAEVNIELFRKLTPAEQNAYNRALFGENADATFAMGLETENFSRCGGCTFKAIEQVFDAEQLAATYYNPLDARINADPRMKKALAAFGEQMREKGFEYDHPDEPEVDIRERLHAITEGGSVPVASLPDAQKEALAKLQNHERRVANFAFDLQEELFEPVELQIEKELYARPIE